MALPLLCGGAAQAGVSLDLENLSAAGMRLEGLHIALQSLDGKPQRLQLTVDKISLPRPFDMLSFFELRCPRFAFDGAGVSCAGGVAKVVSPWLNRAEARADFRIAHGQAALTLDKVQWAGGSLKLVLRYTQGRWRGQLAARNIDIETLRRLTASEVFAAGSGAVDLQADARGSGTSVESLQTTLQISRFNGQSRDGRQAAENLRVRAQLQGRIRAHAWQWQTQLQIQEGALYSDPVYIAVHRDALQLRGRGQWLPASRELRVDELALTHPGLGRVAGRAVLQDGALRNAAWSLQTDALDKFSEVYLQPFLTATAWEGLHLSGRLQAGAEMSGGALTRLDVELPQLRVSDAGRRFALQNGAGALHWARDRPPQASLLSWEGLRFYDLPLGPSAATFSAYGRSVRLNRPVVLPLFGGELRIARFSWQGRPGGEPEVDFQGDIEAVSLEKLTDALHWPPLSGQLAGVVPGVHYRNRQLSIDGVLQVRLFGGAMRIEALQLSGLLGDLPRLNAEVVVDNLDLQQITRRFPFGEIQGRISGTVRDLLLENWRPVAFDAWLGTPEGDASKHRISQKAVDSLASIGGGGATDFVSRNILRVFDNFGYERLGVGCRLQRGVCRLSGVGPAQQGFYIVEGGGLPRIDVIGYNSRIDWQVLLQRLRRVLATDKAVIQ